MINETFSVCRRNFIKTTAAGLFAGMVAGCKIPSAGNRPNVLFIAVDDLRPELGCYGNAEIKTPHFDALAKEGVVFRRTYCQAAACAPSRASLMTGMRPDSTRVWSLGEEFRKTIPDVITMPQHFHKFGYYTVSLGKIFHNHMPDRISFDEPDLRPAEYNTPELIDLYPTLCDLAGIEIPENMEGISLKPLMKDPDIEWKSAAFSQYHRRPRNTPDNTPYMGRSMVTSRYHYVEWRYWDNDKKISGELAAAELYDCQADPEENTNIADLPDNAHLVRRLSRQLKAGWRAALPGTQI